MDLNRRNFPRTATGVSMALTVSSNIDSTTAASDPFDAPPAPAKLPFRSHWMNASVTSEGITREPVATAGAGLGRGSLRSRRPHAFRPRGQLQPPVVGPDEPRHVRSAPLRSRPDTPQLLRLVIHRNGPGDTSAVPTADAVERNVRRRRQVTRCPAAAHTGEEGVLPGRHHRGVPVHARRNAAHGRVVEAHHRQRPGCRDRQDRRHHPLHSGHRISPGHRPARPPLPDLAQPCTARSAAVQVAGGAGTGLSLEASQNGTGFAAGATPTGGAPFGSRAACPAIATFPAQQAGCFRFVTTQGRHQP